MAIDQKSIRILGKLIILFHEFKELRRCDVAGRIMKDNYIRLSVIGFVVLESKFRVVGIPEICSVRRKICHEIEFHCKRPAGDCLVAVCYNFSEIFLYD